MQIMKGTKYKIFFMCQYLTVRREVRRKELSEPNRRITDLSVEPGKGRFWMDIIVTSKTSHWFLDQPAWSDSLKNPGRRSRSWNDCLIMKWHCPSGERVQCDRWSRTMRLTKFISQRKCTICYYLKKEKEKNYLVLNNQTLFQGFIHIFWN